MNMSVWDLYDGFLYAFLLLKIIFSIKKCCVVFKVHRKTYKFCECTFLK